MGKNKVLSKQTIDIDVKPGDALLIVNRKKKLSKNSKITFEGKNIIDIATKYTKIIDNMFISLIKVYLTSLNPIRSVGRQCFEVICRHTGLTVEESKFKLEEILSTLGCDNSEAIFKAFPFKLQAYEKQRLIFAMAFLIKPKLIILDDTIFRLDDKIKNYMLAQLKKLREENNTSLIFISKNARVVAEAVDNIAIMYRGTVIEYGKKDLILKNPIHPYTKYILFYKNNPKFAEASSELKEYIKSSNNMPRTGCSFCLNCEKSSYDCMYMRPEIRFLSSGQQVICSSYVNYNA